MIDPDFIIGPGNLGPVVLLDTPVAIAPPTTPPEAVVPDTPGAVIYPTLPAGYAVSPGLDVTPEPPTDPVPLPAPGYEAQPLTPGQLGQTAGSWLQQPSLLGAPRWAVLLAVGLGGWWLGRRSR